MLLVPSHAEQPQPTDRPIRLLVPLDGSELAEEAILTAELWAEATDAEAGPAPCRRSRCRIDDGDGYAYIPFDPDVEVAEAEALPAGEGRSTRTASGLPHGLSSANRH